MRGATAEVGRPDRRVRISIHAPHAGRDRRMVTPPLRGATFQSTRPMRGATGAPIIWIVGDKFQSTRPMRGATGLTVADHGGDSFQSTRPMRGATGQSPQNCQYKQISIHAPHAGRDQSVGGNFA